MIKQTIQLIGLATLMAGQAAAQTFTTLHSFSETVYDPSLPYPQGTNSDGAILYAGLILSGTNLYGAAETGGTNGYGTVFVLSTNGTDFRTLHSFIAGAYDSLTGLYTNYDGANPNAAPIISGNTLYGTAYFGGSGGEGTVFKVNTDGTGFTNLHSFKSLNAESQTNTDGANPQGGLVLSGYTLYGTAYYGGTNGNGSVFALGTNGTGFKILHCFTNAYGSHRTNYDGGNPYAGLIIAGSTLYGTSCNGGTGGNGTVFKMNIDGTGFTNLHSFTMGALNISFDLTNNDGANPFAGLFLSDSTLYGAAETGGTNGYGTVFALNTNGTGFKVLHTFSMKSGSSPYGNSDGAGPVAALVLSGKTLYGTGSFGGTVNRGTIFALSTNGMDFKTLYSFGQESGDGGLPWGGMAFSGNSLYGTTYNGGSGGNGTVFRLSVIPPLTINCSGTNVIVSWPTNGMGFDFSGLNLQATTNLVSPATWSTVSPSPVVVNTNKAVTNIISGVQKFYRLSQ